MSLDLNKTALQIDQMAQELSARQGDRRQRLQKAIEVVGAFDVAEYEAKRQRSRATLAWAAPVALDRPGARYIPPSLPYLPLSQRGTEGDFCVVAVDGSHIDVDRHIPARCFLINIGVAVLRYGGQPDAWLFSQPRLYAHEDELVIRDELAPYREQPIEGPVLSAMRTVEEIKALMETVKGLPPHIPTLALMDGSLIMFGLVGHGYPDFVMRALIEDGFVAALEALRQLAGQRPLAVASYISLPRSAEMVNALRVKVCPYEVSDCGRHCGKIAAGRRPCDLSVGGLLDREVFAQALEPGERSGVFASASSLVESYYGGHGVCFFYVHAGEEMGRVEIPSWVAEDEALLGLAHALVIDQCRRGPGYPIALMESHEQAVVTTADRQQFAQLVENALQGQRLATYTSEKSRSKRIRWL
jgi:hypothetical protein